MKSRWSRLHKSSVCHSERSFRLFEETKSRNPFQQPIEFKGIPPLAARMHSRLGRNDKHKFGFVQLARWILIFIVFAQASCVVSSSPSASPGRESTATGVTVPSSSVAAGKAEAAAQTPVEQCLAAHERLFGEEGCLSNLFDPERLRVACEGYGAWARNDDPCGANAYGTYFDCLGVIDCTAFDKDKYGNDSGEFRKAFTECRRLFAADMDACIRANNS